MGKDKIRIADEPTISPAIDPDRAVEQWRDRVHLAEEWQYLVVKGGGVARKSDMDAMLMQRFGIDATDARRISNRVTQGLRGERLPWVSPYGDGGAVRWQADRPEPTLEQFPDLIGGSNGQG